MTRLRWLHAPRAGTRPGSRAPRPRTGIRQSPDTAVRKMGAATIAAVVAVGLTLTASSATAATKDAVTPHAETALSETGWTASASTSSSATDAPSNAIDGNLATRYSSDAVQAPGMWFQVNLGSSQSFNQVEMDSSNWSGDYAVGYNVEVSSDGSTFTSVATGTGTSSPETATFTSQTAQYIRVVLTAASTTPWWSIGEFTVYTNGSSSGSSSEGSYGGTAAAVPGTVQAENYDTGGQGVAYNVTAVNGTANTYRTDGVDLEATTDTGGGDNLGWTATGQWFKYTVNVATAGTYTLGLRVAAPSAVTDALHFANASGTNLTGNINIAATGGYQTWTTVNTTVTLPAGTQTLTVDQDNAGWNSNYLTFATTSGGSSGINTTAWYEVVNQNSGLCASAANGATADGTAVEQLACTGATSQLWQFVPTSVTGYYEILNDNAQSEGESWTIAGGVGATASGNLLQTDDYGGTGDTNALFAANPQTGGQYTFTADNSGLCIDTPNASTTSGVQLQQFTCNGTPAQAFNLVQH